MPHMPGNRNVPYPARATFSRVAFALMLWVLAAGAAHAASVYRCVDAHGRLSFQDTPCPAHTQQSRIHLSPQPLIGAPDEATGHSASSKHAHERARSRRHPPRTRRARPRMSWECHAADGEVFYRHKRCPSSIRGDGVVRSRYAEKMSGGRSRRRHDAWGRVRVHGVKITRAEACRRIHSAGAAARDGHLRDATVSTYDHLMGRDPCGSG